MAFLIIPICLILIAIYMLIRNGFVYNLYTIFAEAIKLYNLNLIDLGQPIDVEMWDRMMPYAKFYIRFWDWDCVHILAPEDLVKIRPFMKQAIDNCEKRKD